MKEWTERRLSLMPPLPKREVIIDECVRLSSMLSDPDMMWEMTLALCDVHDKGGSNYHPRRAWEKAGRIAERLGVESPARGWLKQVEAARAEIAWMELPENNPYAQAKAVRIQKAVANLPDDLKERINRFRSGPVGKNRTRRLCRKFKRAAQRAGVVLPYSLLELAQPPLNMIGRNDDQDPPL